MNYFNQKKNFYAQSYGSNPIRPVAEKNNIYKNYYYKQNQSSVVYVDIAGSHISTSFILLERCVREKREEPKATQGKHCWAEKQIPTKFHSYRPVFGSLQHDYFVNGFFNATEEEKMMFGLTFNNFEAYDMCLEAFNEAEEFFASHCR